MWCEGWFRRLLLRGSNTIIPTSVLFAVHEGATLVSRYSSHRQNKEREVAKHKTVGLGISKSGPLCIAM